MNATMQLIEDELARRKLAAEQEQIERESQKQACRAMFKPIWDMWLDVQDVVVYDKYRYENRSLKDMALVGSETMLRLRVSGEMHGWELESVWSDDDGPILRFNGGHPIDLTWAKHLFIQKIADLMENKAVKP